MESNPNNHCDIGLCNMHAQEKQNNAKEEIILLCKDDFRKNKLNKNIPATTSQQEQSKPNFDFIHADDRTDLIYDSVNKNKKPIREATVPYRNDTPIASRQNPHHFLLNQVFGTSNIIKSKVHPNADTQYMLERLYSRKEGTAEPINTPFAACHPRILYQRDEYGNIPGALCAA